MPNHRKEELRAAVKELREMGYTMPEIGRHFTIVELNGGLEMSKQHVYYYLKDADHEYSEKEDLPDWM